jgi:hypothetical protein
MERRLTWIVRWGCVSLPILLMPLEAWAQTPVDGPAPPAVCTRWGPVHRLFHHAPHTLQDKFVGYPATFVEPPLGYYINRQNAIQVAKADAHRFTLYRSDFLPGTNLFSPSGASRFNIMFARLAGWKGPVAIEWTPDQPELARSRRQAVLDTMQQAGRPLLAERVVIAPSPYPGAMGTEAANHFSNVVMRSQAPAQTFALPPAETAATGVH